MPRAEVGRQRLEARAGEVVAEREHVVDRRAAPAEDPLVHVADRADDGPRPRATSLTSSRWATSVSWYSSRKTKRKRERSRSSASGRVLQELDRERDLVAEVERVPLELERAVGLDRLRRPRRDRARLRRRGLRRAPGAHLVGRDDVAEHLLVERRAPCRRRSAASRSRARSNVQRSSASSASCHCARAVEQRRVPVEADQRRVLAHDRRPRTRGRSGRSARRGRCPSRSESASSTRRRISFVASTVKVRQRISPGLRAAPRSARRSRAGGCPSCPCRRRRRCAAGPRSWSRIALLLVVRTVLTAVRPSGGDVGRSS